MYHGHRHRIGVAARAAIVLSMMTTMCVYTPLRYLVTVAVLCPVLLLTFSESDRRRRAFRPAPALLMSAVVAVIFYKPLIGNLASLPFAIDIPYPVVGVLYGIVSLPFLSFLFGQVMPDGTRTDAARSSNMDSPAMFAICLALGIVALAAQVYCAFSHSLWCDEVFTLNLVSHDYADIARLGAADVHPLLYYYIVRAFGQLLELIGCHPGDIEVGRLASVVPFVCMFTVAATVVRRRMGRWVASVAILCMFGMSDMVSQGVEVRMYSWAAMWVFCGYVSLHSLLLRPTLLSTACMILSTVCAAHTHHFAAVAAGWLWICWAVWLLTTGADRADIVRFVVSIALFALGYMPQLLTSLSQFSQVTGSEYWIGPVTWDTIIEYAYILGSGVVPTCMIAAAVAATLGGRRRWSHDALVSRFVGRVGLLMPLWVAGVGIVASLALRPVFVYRYLYPTVPCLWTAVALIARDTGCRNYRMWLSFGSVAMFIVTLQAFVRAEVRERDVTARYERSLCESDDVTYVADSPWTLWTFGVDPNTHDWYMWQTDFPPDGYQIMNVSPDIRITTDQQLSRLADECTGRLIVIDNSDIISHLHGDSYQIRRIGGDEFAVNVYSVERSIDDIANNH